MEFFRSFENRKEVLVFFESVYRLKETLEIMNEIIPERRLVVCREMTKKFEEIIGFEYLKGMHINDSKKELGTRVDRHDSLGKGFIGNNLFEWIMNDPRMDGIPLILETPNEEIWAEEIALLKSYSKNSR